RMRRAALLSFLVIAGCAHAQIDAALEARVPEIAPTFGADGSVRFLEFVVDGVLAPQVEANPHPQLSNLKPRELRYRFVLHTREGSIPVLCTVDASRGSVVGAARASISCDAGDYHFVVSGSGSSEFFAVGSLTGWAEGPSAR